MWRGA